MWISANGLTTSSKLTRNGSGTELCCGNARGQDYWQRFALDCDVLCLRCTAGGLLAGLSVGPENLVQSGACVADPAQIDQISKSTIKIPLPPASCSNTIRNRDGVSIRLLASAPCFTPSR
jgi:hypothetical protein